MTATAGNRSKTVFLRECVQKRNIFSGAIIEIVSLGTFWQLKIWQFQGCHSCRGKIADSVSREAFAQTRRFIRLPILWQITEPS